jgi:hypothetical protein
MHDYAGTQIQVIHWFCFQGEEDYMVEEECMLSSDVGKYRNLLVNLLYTPILSELQASYILGPAMYGL